MEVRHEAQEGNGRFVIAEGGADLGEMTWFASGPGQITIDHTEGFPGSKGKGVGMKLLQAAVSHARAQGWRIVPACSFVAKVMDLAPQEYADVRA